MRGKNIVGIVFSNMHDEMIRELTDTRTMGSVPFGARYRLIDFQLSNMVNSGITKVGVITKSNYQSLMDHLGSGKAWDLSRKREGLYILPPFGHGNAVYKSRVEALSGVSGFLKNCKEEYVLLTDCDVVANIDIQAWYKQHIESGADVSMAYKRGRIPEKMANSLVLNMDADHKIREILFNPILDDVCAYGLRMWMMKRELLMKLVSDAYSRNQLSFERDILQQNLQKYTMVGYEIENFSMLISCMNEYFSANMSLLDAKVRNDLFRDSKPIYTKVRDDMTARYGLGSNVKNSLIADGCVIEGEVENSILFRGVHVGKWAKVSNCILMQDSEVGDNAKLSYVVTDKNVMIKHDRSVSGYSSYPVFISKRSVV